MTATLPACPQCEGGTRVRHQGNVWWIERTATPEEVDDGCELGVAYVCPACPTTPGRVSLADLVALWTAVHGDECWRPIHTHAVRDHLRAVRA